jgi:hypothetical protein
MLPGKLLLECKATPLPSHPPVAEVPGEKTDDGPKKKAGEEKTDDGTKEETGGQPAQKLDGGGATADEV